jgi:dGTPase
LIESICLAHDLGHPPFGHGGEVALSHHMKHHGGFEGNGQTLRIATQLGEYSAENGMDLTRRTLLGLIKYPVTHGVASNYPKENTASSNLNSSKPPKCIHDEEADILDWVIRPFSEKDRSLFKELKISEGKHRKTVRKSLDTSVMELADDIAYGVHDLEDAIALGFITEKEWKNSVLSEKDYFPNSVVAKDENFYLEKLFSKSSNHRKHGISKLVHYFVSNIALTKVSDADSDLLRFNAVMEDGAANCLNTLKSIVFKFVIKRPQVQALEYKGQQIIRQLFETFFDNPERLLPETMRDKIEDGTVDRRALCDYIAGMTDIYATKQYRRLFVPDIGSIFDRL